MNRAHRVTMRRGIPPLAFASATAIAGLALLIVSADGEPESEVSLLDADLYGHFLTDPQIKIRYADHPEYFMKSETPTHVRGSGVSRPSVGDEGMSWQQTIASVGELLDRLATGC